MANEFVARKGLIVSGSTRMSDSLEVDSSVSASSFTGSLDYDNLVNVPDGLVSSSDQINTGSFSGSFFGDGSGLTGIDGFPFTGSAEISGSLNVDGPVTASFFVGDGSGLTNVIAELTTVTTFGQPFTSQTSVTAVHDLDTNTPLVQVYDDNGEQIIPTKIKILNNNEVLVEFPVQVSGTIVVGKGGDLVQSPIQQYEESFTSETSITIYHLLDTTSPIVQVYDENDEQIIPFKIKILNEDSVLLEFSPATTGKVVVAKGGHIVDAIGFSYRAQEFTNTSLVEVSHGFGTDAPIVQVYDDTGLQIIPQEIRIINDNVLEVQFSTNRSGKIAVSKGGHILQGGSDTSGSFTGSFTATEDILPSITDQFDLGSPTNRFRDIYLSGSTIFLGNVKLSEGEDGNLRVVDASENEFSIVEIDTGSINNRLDELENFSSSLDDTFATDDELFATQSLLQGDIDTRLLTSSFNEYTGSTDTRIDNLEIESGSIRSALNNYTSSADLRLDNLETESGSVRTELNNYTSSADLRLGSLESESGSIRTELNNYTSSADLRLGSLEVESGSIRGTFNNFTGSIDTALTFNNEDIVAKGNITVNGDLLVQGTQSIFNTEQFSVENNVIELNTAGAIKGGILVGDITAPSELSGSLLWDGTNDHWIAGISGSEQRIILEGNFNNYTSSVDLRLSSLEVESGSIRNVFNSYTSSANLRLDSLETESGSIRTTFNNFTGSLGNIVTQNSSSITITGGSINGTPIGGTTASTGAFTTISASTSVTTPLVTNAGTLALSATGANVITASTNSTERLHITSTGNMLLGTTTNPTGTARIVNRVGGTSEPDAALFGGSWSISSIGIEPALYLSSNTTTAGVGSSTQTAKGGIGFEYINASNPTTLIIGITGTPAVPSPVRFFNESERMRITSAGEVLVGLTSRVTGLSGFTQLEVSGDEGGITINSNTTTANRYSRLMFTKSGATGSEGLIRYNVNDYHMSLWTNASEKMRIDSAGNVGIGTTTPANKLVVVGGNGNQLSLDNTGQQFTQIDFNNNGTTQSRIWNNSSENLFTLQTTTGRGISFQTDGTTERLRIDSAGNVGIGTTPSAWAPAAAGYSTMQIRNAAFYGISTNIGRMSVNAFVDSNGTNTYISNGFATRHDQVDGEYRWFTAPSGTAGNAISFTQAMTLDASGNLGIGTTSPANGLEVAVGVKATAGILVTGFNSPRIRITETNATITGGIAADTNGIYFDTITNHPAIFRTNATERARITADGYVRLNANSLGIQFNGDTAAANALNDYEEGTWTPTFFGSSTTGDAVPASVAGTYTKIGRQVTVYGALNNVMDSYTVQPAGNVRIGGLPFTLPANILSIGVVVGNTVNITKYLIARSVSGGGAGTSFEIVDVNGTTASDSALLTVANVRDPFGDLYFTLTYFV